MTQLTELVTYLLKAPGITDDKIDVTALAGLEVRGISFANSFSRADAIRSLMRLYYFDMPEIDGKLTAVLRGGDVIATIYRSDMVVGTVDDVFQDMREQAVEFPKKLHCAFSCAETDYVPTIETSEVRSNDVRVTSETTVEITSNITPDQGAQAADIMHKIGWAEQEGRVECSVSEKFAFLTGADLINVEVEPNVLKRFRIRKPVFVNGVIQIEGVIDRQSSYQSGATASPIPEIIPPVSNLPGTTIWDVLDLPALLQSQDTLHVYIPGHGEANTDWNGATIEQLVENEWVERGVMTYPTTMGQVDEVLPYHPAGIDETNTILVSLSDDDIASITQGEFDIGGNAALCGNELINFRDVTPEGDKFRLSYIQRGGLETEPVAHYIGDRFIMLASPNVITLNSGFIGEAITFRVFTTGTFPAATDEKVIVFQGNSQREWKPLNLTQTLVGEDWHIGFEHNPRIGAPNDPVKSVHFIGYDILLTSGGITKELYYPSEGITYTDAEQEEDFDGPVAAWDEIQIYGLNEYTGRGDVAQWVPGQVYNPAMMEYDGTGWYSGQAPITGNKLTAVARFNIASFTGVNDYQTIMAVLGGGGIRMFMYILSSDYVDPTLAGKLQVYVTDSVGSDACIVITTIQVDDGADHLCFAEYDGDTGTTRLYIDGIDVASITTSAIAALGTSPTAAVGVGAREDGSFKVTGRVGYIGYADISGLNPLDFYDTELKQINEITWTEWGGVQPTYWNESGMMDDNKGSAANMTANGGIVGPTYA